jgi:hypothetical protein
MYPLAQTKETGGLVDRETLAARWCCSTETIKRMEKRGEIERIQLGPRAVRYRLADVIQIEGARSAGRKEGI